MSCLMPLLAPLLSDMKIASFNVQRFGLKKVSDPAVVSTLVKVKQPKRKALCLVSAKILHI